MSHYHFYFNKNKQITISVITSKFLAFIEIIYTDHIFLFWLFLYLHFLSHSHIWIRSSVQLLASQKIELMHDIICRWIQKSLQLKRSFSFKNKIIINYTENQIIEALIRFVFFMIINSSISWLLALTNSLTLKKTRWKKHNF